uniref:Uncharacterized protein n=1 Tax=Picornavirales sp. TaxID=1955153 RepID=A0A6M3YNT3_9VIRU|nr:MAG: hypothetical protein 1 [Picornavirales sp.]
MEKTRMLGDLVQDGYNWVKAKVWKTDEPDLPVAIEPEKFNVQPEAQPSTSTEPNVKNAVDPEVQKVVNEEVETCKQISEDGMLAVKIEKVLNAKAKIYESPIYKRKPCFTCQGPATYCCSICRIHTCDHCFGAKIWCSCENAVDAVSINDCRCTSYALPANESDRSSHLETESVSGSDYSSSGDEIYEGIFQLKKIAEQQFEKPELDLPKEKPKTSDVKQLLDTIEIETTGSKIINWIKENLMDFFQWVEESPLITGMLCLATTIATFFGCTIPILSGPGEACQFIKKLSEGLRCAYYAQKGTEGIVGAVGGLINTVKTVLGVSTDAEILDFKKQLVGMNEECRRMLDLAITAPGKFMNDSQAFGIFKQKIENIHKLYRSLATAPNSTQMNVVNPIWHTLNKTFNELSQVFHKMTASVSDRQVPVCIWLWGRSDLGKSRFFSCLADYLNKAMKRHMQVHTLSKGPEYWNCFCQQDIIKIDDFASWVGPEGITDALAVFNLITNAAYNPNMAALSDKVMMATPKFLFVAANEPTIPLNAGVTNLEAFERRRHLFLKVSWPEHEMNCNPGVKYCQHWAPILQKFKETNIYDFSHLTFSLCDPIVSKRTGDTIVESSKDRSRRRNIPVYMQQSPDEIIADGRTVSVKEIVDMCILLEAKHCNEYQVALKHKLASGSVLQSVQLDWDMKPTIMLAGPPGCGKSTVLEKFVSNYKMKYPLVEIKNMVMFDKYCQLDFATAVPSTFVFHDLSGVVNSSHFTKFLDMLRSRMDCKDPNENLWIMAANMNILEQKMIDVHKTAEGAAYYLRGVEIIDFVFKKYFTIFGYKTYNLDDVRDCTDSINNYVDRIFKGKGYSFEQTLVLLNSLSPKLKETQRFDSLTEYYNFQPKTLIKISMTTNEFLRLCNAAHPIAIADVLVRGKKAEFASEKATFTQMAQKLYQAVRKSRASAGCVLDLEAMLVEAWNSGFLEVFKNDFVLFCFTDKQYIIDTINSNIVMGVLINPTEKLLPTIANLTESTKVLDAFDFLDFGANVLTPWICLIGESLLTLGKIVGTALITATAVDQEIKSQRAIATFGHCIDVAKDHVSQQISDIPTRMEATLFPGIQEGVRAPQHGSADVDDPRLQTPPEVLRVPSPRVTRQTPPEGRSEPNPRAKPARQIEVANNPIVETFNSIIPPEKSEIIHEIKNHKEVAIPNLKQMTIDTDLQPVINKVLYNCVEILSKSDVRLCFGLMVKGHLGTTVSHVLDICSKDELYVRLVTGSKHKIRVVEIAQNIDRLDFEIEDKKVQQFPDLVNLISSRDAPPHYNCGGVLINISFDVSSKFPVAKLRSHVISGMTAVKFEQDPNSYYHIKYVGHKVGTIMTGVQTYAGECGSVLLISDPTWKFGKIIGLHVGAGQGVAYARIITSEQYAAKKSFQCIEPSSALDLESCRPAHEDDNPCVIGKAKRRQFVPHRSKLYRNLAPIGEKHFEPAILTDRDTRNPGHRLLETEADKWCQPPVELSSKTRDLLEKIATDTAHYFADILAREGVTLSTLTRMEAINKLSGCSKSEPISVKTSPGFPFCDSTKRPGKHDFIRIDEHGIYRFVKNTDRERLLKKGMDRYTNELHGNGKASTIFKVFLKDEPVALKKIYELPATRTIAAAPLDFQVVFRQYLHSGMAQLAEHWRLLPPKIGICPQSTDWNALFHVLASKNMTAVDIDYAGWDFSQHPFFVNLLATFWNTLYKRLDPKWCELDDKMRNILYSKIVNFLILVGNTIYKTKKGIPSGYPGTATDNSLINLFVQIYCYITLMEKHNPKLASVFQFFIDVAIAIYGDDLIMTFSEYLMKLIKLEEWNALLIKLGFNPTSADKTGGIQFKPLMECQFMSRSFRLAHGMILGPLLLKRLYKTSWWVHDKTQHDYYLEPDCKVTDAQNVASAYLSMLHESVLHGRETYEVVRSAALLAQELSGHEDPIPRFEDLLAGLYGVNDPLVPNYSGVETFNESSFLIENKIRTHRPKQIFEFSNRTTYFYGSEYAYGGAVHPTIEIPSNLKMVLDYFNQKYGRDWNSILVNEYEPGGHIPWHKDDEKCLDTSAGVGCLTIEGDGQMQFRNDNSDFFKFNVSRGDFYIINEENAKNWKHRRVMHFMKTISLTFRRMK